MGARLSSHYIIYKICAYVLITLIINHSLINAYVKLNLN